MIEKYKVISYETGKIQLNEPETILILLKCKYCLIMGVVKELWLMSCDFNEIVNLKAQHIRITSYPPFYKILNKLQQKRWIKKNQSSHNMMTDCQYTSFEDDGSHGIFLNNITN